MDDRQTKITEGAGLQESRLNTEFIDWLQKWGTKALWVVLLAAGAWALYTWNERRVAAANDQAFVSLEAALEARNPENLVRTAEAMRGKGAVASIATLRAADMHLQAARRGVRIEGDYTNEDDLLSDEQRTQELATAERLYRAELDSVRGKKNAELQEMQARAGLAACAITARDLEKARTLITELEAFAREHGFTRYADWNAERIEQIEELLAMPELLKTDDIAAAWRAIPTDGLADPAPETQPTEGEGFGPIFTDDETQPEAVDDDGGFGPVLTDDETEDEGGQ